ncbi:MAG TPA: hypothetical protein VHC95_01925 [Opitutales bacterium]|nr:hypothetical protein [Opitutales bacterium]
MASANPQVKLLKNLIWVYLILLLLEGALRKWVFPGLSNFLLIIRDPLVVLIYMMAIANGRFVFNSFVAANFFLAAACFCAGLILPDNSIAVTLIGLRCYFLHLPLIFVMEKTLEKEDIWRMAKFLLWFAIPETILIVAQFSTPQSSWANRGLGGVMTEGFSGAEGHARPPGTFSFTTGVGAFYPLVVAALLGLWVTRQKLPLYLSVVVAACVLLGIYMSINRTNAVLCAWVLLVGSGAAIFALPNAPKQIVRLLLLVGLAAFLASLLPHFDEGMEAFNSRWESATGTDLSGFQSNIVMRFLDGVSLPMGLLMDTPILGYGVGSGTQMAQGFMTGHHGFALGESEWPRLILEMGPMLGLAFIILRIALCFKLAQVSFLALRRQNVWPALFAVEAIFMVVNANWGQPTSLGFAVFSAGLTFAATHMTRDGSAPKKTRRGRRHRVRAWKPPVEEPALPTGLPGMPS